MNRAVVCLVSLVLAAACGRRPGGVDLVRSERARLVEASAAGLTPDEARASIARPRRIRNVVRASLPAAPPSRFRFVTDVPPDGRLVLAAGIPGRYQDASAVEFVVNVRRHGREQTVLSRLVDPANRESDRGWVPLEADLSEHAGKGVEVVLETRGFDKTDDRDRAFWGGPTIASARDTEAPLVVVYRVDTLRADHLPLYGYSRDTAPELTRFAQDAVVFDQAIAAAPWTKPSVASLFTSLLPREHGCVLFRTPLGLGLVTLAERLREAGYGTGAVVANPQVGAAEMHFDQGFDHFDGASPGRPAGELVDAALSFLDARRGLPTLLYVHTMDTHQPYRPPSPFDRRFPPFPVPGRDASRETDADPADRDRVIGQYDGALAYGDQEFGRFVRGLRERGLYEQATIVFVADHGEAFLDHGLWDHGNSLFDELVRVPLVLKYPGRREAGRRVARQVQLVDVLPTLLKDLGLPVPAGIAGRPLEESLHATGPERPAVFETKFFDHVAYGARTSEAKYVRVFEPGSAELLFDLRRDPGEKQALDVGRMPQARALKQLAERSLASDLHQRVRVDGAGGFDLRLRSTGWIEIVDRVGLVAGDDALVAAEGHELVLKTETGSPEVEFVVRPSGAPVWIDGSYGRRRLRPSDVHVAAQAQETRTLPMLLPDIEELDTAPASLPPAAPGVSVWLVVPNPGRGSVALDAGTKERLKALGYSR
jgi:arylsulfatase A-like enzyme